MDAAGVAVPATVVGDCNVCEASGDAFARLKVVVGYAFRADIDVGAKRAMVVSRVTWCTLWRGNIFI